MMESDATKIREALDRVAEVVADKSLRKLAEMLGVSTQALYKFCKEGVPVKRALQMSVWTKGKVQWYELAPHVLEELRQAPKGDEA